MIGNKEVLWAVAISAALITAGLILSCGDDDDGGVSCKDACDIFEECGWIGEEGYLGETVEECVMGCEENMDPADEEVKEFFECIVDADDCDAVFEDCWCTVACVKLDDCDLLGELEYENVEECVDYCAGWSMNDVLCVLETECGEMESCY